MLGLIRSSTKKRFHTRALDLQHHQLQLERHQQHQIQGKQEVGRRRRGVSEIVSAVKVCSASKDVEQGRQLHAEAIDAGCISNIFVASSLVSMYAKCGSLGDAERMFEAMEARNIVSWTALMLGYVEENGPRGLIKARDIFDKMPQHDIVSWNALVLAYADNGEARLALDLFESMMIFSGEGWLPNARTYVAALKACACLAVEEQGRMINRNVVKLQALDKAMAMHCQVLQRDWESDVFVANTLVDLYAKCGSLVDARGVFDRMAFHTVVSWNALLLGYAENGEDMLVFDLFASMLQNPSFCEPNSLTFVAALKACTNLAVKDEEQQVVDGKLVKVAYLEKGREIHVRAEGFGFSTDLVFANTLVDMYAKCGSMVDARRVFDSMLSRSVVSWNALLLGYVDNGEAITALELFDSMRCSDCVANARTFVAALKACSSLAEEEEPKQIDRKLIKLVSLEKGMAIHSEAARSGCEKEVFVETMLVDMYAKCGSLADARRVFDRMQLHSVVSWTALITGYAENGEEELALELLSNMVQEGCFAPDTLAYVAVVKACASLAVKEQGTKQLDGKLVKVEALKKGMAVHYQAAQKGCDSDTFLANVLVDMYARCGSMEAARRVFDKMAVRNMVSWNALILGYIESGEEEVALEAFACMRRECCGGKQASQQNFAAVLKACGNAATLRFGKAVHRDACRLGFEMEPVLATSFVDVYGKCGSVVDAQHVFDCLALRDSVSWTALLAGYSRQGNTERVFQLFHAMGNEGCGPNAVTFTCLLTACSHAGLVEQGTKYFQAMELKYGISPQLEHYHCMIDILGRANQLEAAVKLLETMPFEASVVTWKTVLGACQKWNNMVVGKLAFESLQKLNQDDPGALSLMSNIYMSGMWQQSQTLASENGGSDIESVSSERHQFG